MRKLFDRGSFLGVRLDAKQKSALQREAQFRGVPLSELARQLLTIEADKTHTDGASFQTNTVGAQPS